MFHYKKKTIAEFVQSFTKPKVDVNEIVKQIHHEFDTAGEKLLADAKQILATAVDTSKGEMLASLGFHKSKKSVESIDIIRSKEQNKKLADTVEYFRMHYPNQKFITEDMVSAICKKYGLLFAESHHFISDIPDKNLLEISNFKMREDDMRKLENNYWAYDYQGISHTYIIVDKSQSQFYGHCELDFMRGVVMITEKDETKKHSYHKPSFKIAASPKDFDTANMYIEDGYKLNANIPDPIVLQPVKGGYLIVSKWGIEGEDALLTNESQN